MKKTNRKTGLEKTEAQESHPAEAQIKLETLSPHFKCIFSITFMAPGGKIKFYDAPQRHSRVFAPLQKKFRDNDVPAQRVKNEVRN